MASSERELNAHVIDYRGTERLGVRGDAPRDDVRLHVRTPCTQVTTRDASVYDNVVILLPPAVDISALAPSRRRTPIIRPRNRVWLFVYIVRDPWTRTAEGPVRYRRRGRGWLRLAPRHHVFRYETGVVKATRASDTIWRAFYQEKIPNHRISFELVGFQYTPVSRSDSKYMCTRSKTRFTGFVFFFSSRRVWKFCFSYRHGRPLITIIINYCCRTTNILVTESVS